MKLSVLMPVYNEIGTIAEIVKLVAAALPDIEKELVIVDDGSRDGTRDWLITHFGPVPLSLNSSPIAQGRFQQ